MKTKLMIAAWVAMFVSLAAAHPHPGLDDIPLEPYVAPELSRAFESAWKMSLESVQAEGQFARAEAERDVAASLLAAPPALQFDHRQDRASGSSTARESEAALVLPLWMPGQRRARAAAADAQVGHAEASLHAARLQIAGEVRETAWQLLAADGDEAAARSHLEGLQSLAADVERRVRAGDLAPADGMAATAEMLSARAAHGDAQARLEGARERWALLTGMPAITSADEPDPVTGSVEHAAVVLAKGATLRAQRQLDYVKATRRDPVELSLKVRRETSDANLPAQNGAGIGVRIPFGSVVRNAPRDAEALAALENARAEEQRIVRRLESEARTARSALEGAKRALQAVQSRAALLRERGQLIDKSFRAGETPLPELLRARDAASQAESSLARQRAEVGLARARLLQSLGILP